jgi:hypothetical protein
MVRKDEVVPLFAVEAYVSDWSYSITHFKMGTRLESVSSFTLCPFYPSGKSPWVQPKASLDVSLRNVYIKIRLVCMLFVQVILLHICQIQNVQNWGGWG